MRILQDNSFNFPGKYICKSCDSILEIDQKDIYHESEQKTEYVESTVCGGGQGMSYLRSSGSHGFASGGGNVILVSYKQYFVCPACQQKNYKPYKKYRGDEF